MRNYRAYWLLKPLIPRPVQIYLRQHWARRKRAQTSAVWPILEAAGAPPPGWRGWPEGKQFALVLTHDVESARGIEKSPILMELEERLGFRSCFNFVPEGYRLPPELRADLVRRGFEVGVHGLVHDAHTFRSRRVFAERAKGINRYLKAWNAAGFRAPLMTHNLDWIGELEIEYDSSTFDTDPFEPQPDGVETVFPFMVGPDGDRRGYVELPYTLPQDFTLFVMLRESGIETWKRKLDWIAAKGGMASLDVHPDYVSPNGRPPDSEEYPLRHYEDFLLYVKERYAGRYWHALPRDVARHCRSGGAPRAATVLRNARRDGAAAGGGKTTIWIDLDNTPHVPFFRPIIRELEERGHRVLVTARDAFQVFELADRMGVRCVKIGRHHGKNKLLKAAGLCYRAAQLAPLIRKEKPDLAVSHGSRSQLILASTLRIPSVLISDYEFVQGVPLVHPTWLIVPEVIPDEAIRWRRERLLRYPGIKEDVYVPDFTPDPSIVSELGLGRDEIVVTVRPPATEAHYHNPESEKLLDAVMGFILRAPETRIVLMPRNKRQSDSMRAIRPQWFAGGRAIIPQRAVDGLNLLWHSDLVVSGGGTMNREAAALGVPVYSVFRGAIGAVDRYLRDSGRLVLIEDPIEIPAKILIRKRSRGTAAIAKSSPALPVIIQHVEDMLCLSRNRADGRESCRER